MWSSTIKPLSTIMSDFRHKVLIVSVAQSRAARWRGGVILTSRPFILDQISCVINPIR